MNSKLLLLLPLLLVVLGSCTRTNDENLSFDTLKVPKDFNWSTISDIEVNVNIITPGSVPVQHIENFPLDIYDDAGNRLARKSIKSGAAKFNIQIPANVQVYFVVFPATNEYVKVNKVNSVEQVTLHLERMVQTRSTEITVLSEIFPIAGRTNYPSWIVQGGDVNEVGGNDPGNFAPRINTDISHVWGNSQSQRLLRTPAMSFCEGFTVSFRRRIHANTGAYTELYLMPASGSEVSPRILLGTFNFPAINTWYNQELTFSLATLGVPPGEYRLGWATFNTTGGSSSRRLWIDNVNVTSFTCISDTDGDGVPDQYDEFPDDPNAASTTYLSGSGYIYNCFEDLWPSKGDYDFNDMVVASRTFLNYNANNQAVSGGSELVLRCVSGSLKNGLGVQFLNGVTKASLPNNTISNFTNIKGLPGLQAEPSNTATLFTNVFDAQDRYYANDGEGPDATVLDTFRFTFQVANSTLPIQADFFIFIDQDRSHEVHAAGFPPTALANTALFNVKDDRSEPGNWYKTFNGLPFALKIWVATGNPDAAPQFKHPLSKVRISDAYPQIIPWAQSGGLNNKDWYLSPVSGSVFQGF